MQSYFKMRVPFQNFQKWKITMGVGILENVFEIADGLMIVDGKGEFEFFHLIKVWYCWGKQGFVA
jgi:hypothetical protein